jgi:hypothetical protein
MPGAHVVMTESDDTGEDGVSVTQVSVNGVDVGMMSKPPRVSVGTGGARTTVTLTLAVSRLEIRGEHADGERRTARLGFTAELPSKES